ncbi:MULTISPECIES: family 2 encapsulin nanocompartment cargo protein terpene cyclase [Streptomyces]|uniref:family 2 encapsulin nanocompartment cargo protein terpene cyclase n=1 Tax=Streptomyces TaxID=1883 RepID=UPI00064CE60B|nr:MULTISPECIES: family 2 encapsulin nanocompartment cargo protein terpene cyclase [Streptomyces]AKL64808.1 2-methylisoborneol synthase [Streptomyces sp. Mg1]RPK41196.1 2-methylisoborneol synthase [Streptomyces sp. ADI91-18]WBY18712.1 family 2 encapsulin nanocompartment cargo protein terpene cyclase [Streptomyces goshikiensis]WSR97407.1 family 2 encapsulin nanocompartment cargo protein terpene cyclase [Streptomyces goshikiensis]
MPDPGSSPLQSSLPAAAARFGTHGHGSGIEAFGGGPPVPPVLPAAPPAPAGPPAPARTPNPAMERILRGPSGLGTAGLFLSRREEPPAPAAEAAEQAEPAAGRPVPGLYHHPVPEPDPVRVEEVSRRIKEWAVDEVELYPPEWEDQFDGFSVGRYMVACHPDAPTVDHLMIATRLMVAENVVDDCYCEDHGGSPVGLGGRLLLAHTALDALHTTREYAPDWEESLHSDAPRRAYRSAMEYFTREATASQADRYRHDMARLHLGYLAEAAWAQTDYVPQVWEYLAMRQFNNFRPCPTITDTVGGYELPADLHAQAAVQRVIALAGNATTIVNDLYSYTKELASPGRHLNLPVVVAEHEGGDVRDAYLKAVEVHNDLMHAFEAEAAELAAACPVPSVLRFLRGVAAWVDGNHYWHQTNTYRYSLPDFW